MTKQEFVKDFKFYSKIKRREMQEELDYRENKLYRPTYDNYPPYSNWDRFCEQNGL